MSNPNESTPLLYNQADRASRHSETGDDRYHHTVNIAAEARSILNGLTTDNSQITPPLYDRPYLAVLTLLYASHLISQDLRIDLDEGISPSVIRELAEVRRLDRLDHEIEKVLDSWATEPGQRGMMDDENLCDALWVRWDIENLGQVSALDLMARGKPSRHLSHPIVVRFIDRLYYAGLASLMCQRAGGKLRSIEASITPRRVAILHIISHLVLWVLTMVIAKRSDSWINSSHLARSRPQALEIIWSIFVSAAMTQVLQSYRRSRQTIFLLPSILALLTSWTTYANYFLLVSIPTLTVSIIWPEPPSIPFVFPSFLPSSVRVWDIFFAGFNGWGLIWPIITVMGSVLSFALNGDIFRGLSVIIATLDTRTEGKSLPVEEGVAPYSTRLTLFSTMVFLLYLAVCLSISNIVHPNRPVHPGQGNSRGRDERVNGHGQDVALRARAKWVLGTRWLVQDLGPGLYIPSGAGDGEQPTRMLDEVNSPPPVPLLFNILLVPLDIVIGLIKILAVMLSVEVDWSGDLRRIRYILVVWVIGIPCYMLKLFV